MPDDPRVARSLADATRRDPVEGVVNGALEALRADA